MLLKNVVCNVPDRYKTQERCHKIITESGDMLMVVSYCYKNKRNWQ